MKAIMISIKPEWVAKILNGDKTIEIRKTMPKCELPCKAYIYCTRSFKSLRRYDDSDEYGKYRNKFYITDHNKHSLIPTDIWNGEVVAEFTLNKVDTIEICDPYVFRNKEQEDWWWFKANACLDCEQIMEYIGYGSDHDGWGDEYAKGYAWHIDDLKIYDEPRELRERLTKAIVLPNFKKGQEVFIIRKNEVVKANFQDFSKWIEAEVVYNPKTTIYDDGFVDVDYDFDMADYKMVFATEAEAQAKLDEIRRNYEKNTKQ